MKAKKLLTLLMASMIGASWVPAIHGQILHTERIDQSITSGVKLVSEAILTDAGWQDINILKVNLGNKDIEIRPIESNKLGERQTISQMVDNVGAVAGVNADFFDMQASYAPSFGVVIEDGQIKHSYNYKYTNLGPKKHMATFLLDENNNPFLNYYGISLEVLVEDAKAFDVTTYNTLTGSLSRPIIVDSRYYKDNTEIINKYRAEGVYTVLVEDGKVIYCSRQDEIVSIPEGTEAIILSAKDAALYYPLLAIGSNVQVKEAIVLNEKVTNAVEEMQMGIGGGGLIMQDGKPYTGSAHKVSADSKQPRTILATTNTAQEVLLITIDGRNGTLGASHKDLPEILSKYNVKDAMYLDGGGSTTLVARNEGEEKATVQNRPSEGKERKVTNGIGVFSTAPEGTLNKLYIKSSNDRTFVGEGVSFKVSGVDERDNPVAIEENQLKLSTTGVTGTWQGMTFYPESEGKGLVVAEVNGVEVATEIKVTSGPVGLYIEPANLQMNENSQSKVQIYGVDKEGYKIPVTSEKVEWTSNRNTVKANGNSVNSGSKEIAVLTAKYKNAVGTIGVTVGDAVVPVESFEENIGKWSGDTTTVRGKVEPSKEVKYHGEQSLKMTYTFDKDTNKQVAYTIFEKPIEIPSESKSINMWVYAKGQNDTLKLQLQDSAGKTYYLKVTDSLKYDGWKYQNVVIPEEVQLPAKVSKLYVTSNSNTARRENAVYIDHLSITRGDKTKAGIQVRDDYRYDPMYKETLSVGTGNDYIINVTGATHLNSMKLSNQEIETLSKKLGSEANVVIQAAKNNVETNFGKSTYTYSNQYEEADYKDTKVLFLGTDSGSIRKTNPVQWTQMKQSIEKTNANHIIMVMSKNPLTQFEDAREGKALHDYLAKVKKETGKNIFVVYSGGTEKEVRIEDGIRYIRVNGLSTVTDNPKDGAYLKFKVHEGSIYYTFEPMM
ncbi:MAG: phosphodiester glycosidase family protein [Cellulosilyticaceae bacterium]